MKYILYGAGKYMKECIDDDKIKYFEYIVDNSPNKIGSTYLDKEIKSPKELFRENKNNIFIVISAEFSTLYLIEYDLKQMGFEKGKHFDWIERLITHYPNHMLWNTPKSQKWEQDEQKWRDATPNGMPTERANLVAKMIDWNGVNSVLDFGAGSEPIRSLLPQNTIYYPIDYKKITSNTMIYDFNQKQFPNIIADVAIMIGVHEYINYETWLLDKAVNAIELGGQLIISFYYNPGSYNVFDFIIKYHDKIQCIDYVFRDNSFGIYKFKRIK